MGLPMGAGHGVGLGGGTRDRIKGRGMRWD